jgi:transcriptional regulator with XRE-family HTH domain
MRLRAIFAANLRRARQAAGVSQEELANLAGVDRTYVSSLERSVYAASVDVIERISEALNVEPSDLLIVHRRSRAD